MLLIFPSVHGIMNPEEIFVRQKTRGVGQYGQHLSFLQ